MKWTAVFLTLILVLMMATSPLVRELNWMLDHAQTPRLRSVREFAEDEVVIPKGQYKGTKLRLDVQPFAALLFEALDSGRWPRTAITGCVQSGKSTLGYGVPAMFHLFEMQETCILGAPTTKVCRDKYMQEIEPLIRASRYAELLPTDGAGSRGGFSEEIRFSNGAALKFMSGGGGDENRSSYTSRVVILTEADKMDTAGAVSREADPVSQMEARSFSWRQEDRRFYCECTVSIPEGRIWTEYQHGTASRIACPCPHCKSYVTPEREHLRGWQECEDEMAARRGAHYCCPACGATITEDQRREMNLRGKLVHRGQQIDAKGKITGDAPDTLTLGFRWNCFNNLFISAGEVGAKEWAAKRTSNEEAAEKELCQFYWAVPYSSPDFDTAPLDPDQVRRRFAPKEYTKGLIPADAEHLSMGIDLGKRVGHWVLTAWRPGARAVIVEYSTFEVPSDGMGVEKAIVTALEDLRDDTILPGWRTLDGRVMLPNPVFVDAGYMDDSVYEFCRQKLTGKRFRPAIGRGLSQHDRRLRNYHHPTKTGAEVKLLGQQYYVSWVPDKKLFRVDVNADWWKTWLFNRLRTPLEEIGSMELYASNDRNEHITLAKHFAAERPEEKFVEGKGTVTFWVKEKKGNHYLDAAYNACAAGHLAGVRLIDRPRPSTAESPRGPGGASPIVTPDGRPFLVTERS